MYEVCLQTIKSYARFNCPLTADSTAEEDSFQDIMLLMQLLTNLLSKDLCNFGQEDARVEPAVIFLDGLEIIMPMITTDLLKFPSLCSK